ncbi:tyrosine-type recombinase/integrase [Scandinavium sp. H11S7]|uniref:Tyrosine-type recombinase/integrase n=1 Tax=Scandinavium hiltneri TaxID=2926519 RepID=A0ABT2E122_9ENTR|nr:tyrosine-type recombinase/integrase [Scandinavium hiltneri]MCS2161554.1 tyrosine-type recombinase/integrase [Scandinavium hiltneri]
MLKTKTDVQRFSVPENKNMKKENVFNNGLTGLYLVARRNPSGTITKSWRYIASGYDITLGTFPAYSLEDARQWHSLQVSKVKRGQFPDNTVSGTPKNMDQLFNEWLQIKCPEPSKTNRQSIWNKHCKSLHGLPPEKLTYQNVYMLLLALGPSNAAHRVCQIIRTIMLYAFQAHAVEGQSGHPVYVPQKLSEVHDRKAVAAVIGKVRENRLSKEQYRCLWKNLGNTPSHAAMRFLMITGARKSEITQMVWSELDLKANIWTLPASRTKTRQERIYPLSSELTALLKEWAWTQNKTDGLVWGYIGKSTMAHAAERLRSVVGNDFTTHDIRRSAASLMSGEAGIDPMIVDLLLGHSVKAVTSKILATYQPKAFQKAVDAAWPVWFKWFRENIE